MKRGTDIESERARLLGVARAILDADGADGLNVRSIAQAGGVSTMAIYSRFGGKDGLIDGLYAEGFGLLAQAQRAVLDETRMSPRARLISLCLAYREVALNHRGHYRIMTMPPAGFQPSVQGEAAARETFETLVGAVQACRDGQAEQARDIAYGLFGLCHGIVSLELLGFGELTGDPETAYREAIERTVGGL